MTISKLPVWEMLIVRQQRNLQSFGETVFVAVTFVSDPEGDIFKGTIRYEKR